MKSRYFFLFLLLVFAISACTDKSVSSGQDEMKKEVMVYFNDSITPKIVWEYSSDDSLDIIASHYYYTGALQMKGHIKNGVRNGKWTAWDKEGRMLSTGHYVDGMENGMWTVWFPSGKKRYEGLFKDGKRSGLWKFYDENGQLIKEIEY